MISFILREPDRKFWYGSCKSPGRMVSSRSIFRLEERIASAYPEQALFYEDDEAWVNRKQQEERKGTGHF